MCVPFGRAILNLTAWNWLVYDLVATKPVESFCVKTPAESFPRPHTLFYLGGPKQSVSWFTYLQHGVKSVMSAVSFFAFVLTNLKHFGCPRYHKSFFFLYFFFPTCGDWDDLRTLCSKTLTLKSWFSLLRRTFSSTFAAGNSPTVYRGFWPTGSFLSLPITSREVAPKRRIVRPNCPCFVSFQVGSLLFLLATPALPKRTNTLCGRAFIVSTCFSNWDNFHLYSVCTTTT